MKDEVLKELERWARDNWTYPAVIHSKTKYLLYKSFIAKIRELKKINQIREGGE